MKKLALDETIFELNGMPWYTHNGNRLWRLPYEIEDSISKELWEGSKNTSGGRIRFCSDTTLLGLCFDYGQFFESVIGNMCRFGIMGIDLYVDGKFWNCMIPQKDTEAEKLFFNNVNRELRQFTIYLPLYHKVDIKKIILDDDAVILPPEKFSIPKPVVYYGTSITQGGCASRAGLSYQAMLSRELNIDFINLGFNGLGKGEIQVAEAASEIDASCYVLDYAQNNESLNELENVYYPYISHIRKKHPETPIILTTPIPYAEELWNNEFREMHETRRQIIRNAYKKAVDSQDKFIYLFEGQNLLPIKSGDGQVDGCHPNDLGFYIMSGNLKTLISKVLNCK